MRTLRIIAGRWRGQRLLGPDGDWLRPTADRMKETVFNVLQEYISGARVLDLFAGTGNLGLEALSRGARSVVLVERERRALALLGRNLERLQAGAAAEVVVADAIRYSARPVHGPFDLVLADPPYAAGYEAPLLAQFELSALVTGGWFVLQHSREVQPVAPAALRLQRCKRFGDTQIDFWWHAPPHRLAGGNK